MNQSELTMSETNTSPKPDENDHTSVTPRGDNQTQPLVETNQTNVQDSPPNVNSSLPPPSQSPEPTVTDPFAPHENGLPQGTYVEVPTTTDLDAPTQSLNAPPDETNPGLKVDSSVIENQSLLTNQNPIQLAWMNLEYKVDLTRPIPKLLAAMKCKPCGPKCKPNVKQILHPMTGFVQPGQVLAIMGPSGSGKTSLLNILALRVPHSKGAILINGAHATKKFKTVSAYVQQDDILNGNLTVYEALMFTAALRLPAFWTWTQKKTRVMEIIDELGLRHCKDTKIGVIGVSKGISGGERKRVSIGVELLTSPSVLFLDEPTSGLDSKTALSLMSTINKLAKDQNRTVVCTIHQPRSDIYGLFDKLLLLTDGKVAYFGDAQKAISYYNDLGYEMPDEYNPADFLIDLITKTANDTEEYKSRREEERERIKDLTEHHLKNPVKIPKVDSEFILEKRNIPKYNQYMIVEFFILLVRFSLNILRDKMFTFVRAFQAVFMALLVGFIYFQVKDNQKSIGDRIGALFFLLVNQAMGSLFGAIMVFQGEKEVYLRERGSKTYRVGSYFMAKIIAEVPIQVFLTCLLTVIAYFMIGFNPSAGAFFSFTLLVVTLALAAQGLGLAISVFSNSLQTAFALGPVLTTVLMVFGGFYLNRNSIGPWFIWIHYISFYKYAFEALMLIEFQGRTFQCFEGESFTIGTTKFCPITTGQQVIKNYGIEDANIWINFGMLVAMAILTRIFAYLLLRFRQKPVIKR